MTIHPCTQGALAASACCPQAVPLGGSPLDVVAHMLSHYADYLDSQANGIDPHGNAGHGRPWDFMQVARQLRDLCHQINVITQRDET